MRRIDTLMGTQFRVTETDNGLAMITSIHPYDETEYHWARQVSKSTWHIIRNGLRVLPSFECAYTGKDAHSQIEMILLQADEDAHLKPIKAIW